MTDENKSEGFMESDAGRIRVQNVGYQLPPLCLRERDELTRYTVSTTVSMDGYALQIVSKEKIAGPLTAEGGDIEVRVRAHKSELRDHANRLLVSSHEGPDFITKVADPQEIQNTMSRTD